MLSTVAKHVQAAKSWPSLASLSTCCLNSQKAAAWRILASVAAGMSMLGITHAAYEVAPRANPGHPWNRRGQERSPLPRPRKKKMNAILGLSSHLSQNVAFIGPLKDDTCTPKACQTQCMNIPHSLFVGGNQSQTQHIDTIL